MTAGDSENHQNQTHEVSNTRGVVSNTRCVAKPFRLGRVIQLDSFFDRAARACIKSSHPGISLLQRELNIDFTHAMGLIEKMAAHKIIRVYRNPTNRGHLPFRILMTLEKYEEWGKQNLRVEEMPV